MTSVRSPQIGPLLNARHRELREEIQAAIEAAGFTDFRLAHQAVFAALPAAGARMGYLANRAQLAKQTITELVAYLADRGYVERSPDPSDGRAQLVRRTPRGDAVDLIAQAAITRTARRWRRRLGRDRFEALTAALADLEEISSREASRGRGTGSG